MGITKTRGYPNHCNRCGYGEKSEKIWVRDMAEVKINKMEEKGEVQFKEKRGKKTRFACKSF